MPAGMEFDLVDPIAVTIMGPQFRFVPVGLLGPPLRGFAARLAPEPPNVLLGPARPLADQPLQQRCVFGGVVRRERRRLVRHLVGERLRWCESRDHVTSVALILQPWPSCN